MLLKKGSKGEQVKELQKALGIAADGMFGPGTEKSVISFQKANGLTADGIVGQKTWEVLGIDTDQSNTDWNAASDTDDKLEYLGKYTTKDGQPAKGCPVHVRGAINYNFLLSQMGLDSKIEPIKSNEKIFWVYLKQNPYGFNNISFKKEDNPKEIEEFIKSYVDSKKNFHKAVNNKIEAFYGALNWTLPVDSVNTLDAFF